MHRVPWWLLPAVIGCQEPVKPAPARSGTPATATSAPTTQATEATNERRFKHQRSRLVAKSGSRQHGGEDVVVAPGDVASITAKFAYGRASQDLEDEPIDGFISVAGKRMPLGEATTDDDGLAQWSIPKAVTAKAGRHPVDLVVRGDGTRAKLAVWVVEKKRTAVVFDIDGTLTTSDGQLFEQILAGREGDIRPGAQQVAKWYHDQGHQLIYITGRPRVLSELTRAWLTKHELPAAPLLLTRSMTEAAPISSGVQVFKKTMLEGLRTRLELQFVAVYGNATTDICAYAQSGIDPRKTFIVGENGGKECEGFAPSQKVPGGYVKHLSTLE